MGVLIRQIFDQAPETPPKRLFPIVQVKRDSTVLNTVPEFSINKSEENIGDSFNISFMGQDEFEYLHPLNSLSEYCIITGYNQEGTPLTKIQVIGICKTRGQKLIWNNLSSKGEFITGVRRLIAPYAQKINVDVYLENRSARQSWKEGDDIENQVAITSASQLIELILQGTGITFTYAAYDYKITNYQREGYPIEIIKDIVDFIGGYMVYDHVNNRLEIKDKNFFKGDNNYDFFYADNGDITELSYDTASGNIYNAVMIKGILPDDNPEYKDFYDKDAQTADKDKTSESSYTGGLDTDDQEYLIDTIQGTKKAPEDPYRDEVPTELIEEKFYNTMLNFDIDSSSIKVDGGSWNVTDKKYAGAEFLGYGSFVSSSDVLVTDVNADRNTDSTSSNRTPLAAGEGLVGFPWCYEENKDGEGGSEYALQENVYRNMSLKGTVKEEINKTAITGAAVSLDFALTGNIWQYWKNSGSNFVVLFYMPADTVGAILGEGWEDVTADYDTLEAPANFPKSAISGRLNSENIEEGVFIFTEIPISQYTVTVNATGYDEGELDVDVDPASFDFLKSGNKNEDKNSKYKLLDTPYYVVVYGKKAPPIVGGPPATATNTDTEEKEDDTYKEDAKVDDTTTPKNISIDLRCTRGINLAGGRLIYAPPITDSRITSREIAIKAGSAVLLQSLLDMEVVKLQLPHNPWLEVGHTIAVQSYVKEWTETDMPLLLVKDIQPSYSVSENGEEGIWDVVTGVIKL